MKKFIIKLCSVMLTLLIVVVAIVFPISIITTLGIEYSGWYYLLFFPLIALGVTAAEYVEENF